jgi:hypothetical protein
MVTIFYNGLPRYARNDVAAGCPEKNKVDIFFYV